MDAQLVEALSENGGNQDTVVRALSDAQNELAAVKQSVYTARIHPCLKLN